MNRIEIRSIKKEHYKGKVYNLELKSKNSDNTADDLFWVEQDTGIITHNCFPKDINALIKTFEKNNLDPLVLKAGWEQNKNIRTNWDWINNPSAVSKKK